MTDEVVRAQSPLNQATTQSTALASNGLAGSAMVVACWVLWKFWSVTVPPEVALAASVFLQGIVHPFYVKWTAQPAESARPAQ